VVLFLCSAAGLERKQVLTAARFVRLAVAPGRPVTARLPWCRRGGKIKTRCPRT
jgi:hypothetical protein